MTALLIRVSVVSRGISATPALLTTSASGAFSFNLSAQVNKFAKQLLTHTHNYTVGPLQHRSLTNYCTLMHTAETK